MLGLETLVCITALQNTEEDTRKTDLEEIAEEARDPRLAPWCLEEGQGLEDGRVDQGIILKLS